MDQPTFSLEGREVSNNEELAFLWTIPKVETLADAVDNNPDVSDKKFVTAEFYTGDGTVPNWEVFLAVVRNPTKTIQIGLQYSGPESCLAKCQVYFRSPAGKLLGATTIEKQEYTEGSIGTCRLDQNIRPNDNLEEFFQNGTLQLQLNLTVPNRTPDGMQSKVDILKVFKNGLDSGVGSDITFVFEEEGSRNVIAEIRAHNAILFFHSHLLGEMPAHRGTDGKTRVRITEMSPQGMKHLLQFLYSGEMDKEWKSFVEELIHATQKYRIGLMQKFLRENIDSALTAQNAMKIRNWGEEWGFPDVVAAATKFMKDNFEEFLCFHNITSKDAQP